MEDSKHKSYDNRHYDEGIKRELIGSEFKYTYIDSGKEVSDKDLARILKLRIPPAWKDVWISKDPNSSIQVVGLDSKNRKQYKYHEVHINKAEREKFERMFDFIKKLPILEKKLKLDNDLPWYKKEKVLSLMIKLIKDYNMRVGKEVYAKTNKSFGISSLLKKHVKIEKGVVYLNFKGKSNQRLRYVIKDPEYVDGIKMLMKLDGDKLFQYISDPKLDGEKTKVKIVRERDLNKYVQQNLGEEFTIKDFRTFGANVKFIESLLSETRKRLPKNRKIIKKNLLNAIKSTAKKLKHTGAVSKKSYILNFSIEMYQNNPEFFIENKNENPEKVLLKLLKLYRSNVLEEN